MKGKEMVFVVDDNPSMRYSLQRYFMSKGMEVKCLTDGFEVLLLCQYMIPDLIISDIRMPRLDGMTMLQGLRNNEKTKDIPLILMTAYPSDEIMEQAKSLGAVFFLIKPFNLDYINELLKRAIPQLVSEKLTAAAG